MEQMIVNMLIIWLNQCIHHVIQVGEVWEIGGYGIEKKLGLNTQDKVDIK